MPRVNFYLLPQHDEAARRQFACRLAEKLLRQGLSVQILASSAEEAAVMDALLWSYPLEAFVPHAQAHDSKADQVSVLICHGAVQAQADNLLNLSDNMPESAASFATIAEFVLNDAAARAQSRNLWNQYKQSGCELLHHQM